MTSVLNVDTIADKAGTGPVGLTKQHAAKAWVNFTTATSTAIADSFNVGSLTDEGTGYTTITFTNAMSNQDYSKSMSAGTGGYAMYAGTVGHAVATTTEFRHYAADGGTPTARDCDDNSATVHGDLA